MVIEKIGLMTPGDMGQAVAQQLQARGLAVCTALEGRSARSRTLAQQAGLTDLGSIGRLVAECDAVLSIMNPGAAVDFARQAADALRATGRRTLVVDCNAIAPDTARAIATMVRDAGGGFLDASIIGPPPRGTAKATLYVSGPGAADLAPLAGPQLRVAPIGEQVGDASALKMCFAGLNKGTQLLWLELLVAARRLGVHQLLEQELRGTLGDMHAWALGQFPMLPPKAYRWDPEMREIAKTLGAAGMSEHVFQGAAATCRHVAATALGQETPENRDRRRDGRAVVQALAQHKPPPAD